jgi:hypothetical protein
MRGRAAAVMGDDLGRIGNKLAIWVGFVVLAALVAGLYGALQNQISYTVAPEYFTLFKFRQFRVLDATIPERLRAACVGIQASWWMGALLGLLVGMAGLVHRDPAMMGRRLLQSMWLCLGIVLAFSLLGLLYGYVATQHIDLTQYHGWFIPRSVTDLRRFLCAGYMHNAAYLGGAAALPVGWAFHLLVALHDKRAARRESEAPRP